MTVNRSEPTPPQSSNMQYKIEIIVTEKDNGEEIYRRDVPLLEQVGMLEGDIEQALKDYEENN